MTHGEELLLYLDGPGRHSLPVHSGVGSYWILDKMIFKQTDRTQVICLTICDQALDIIKSRQPFFVGP